MSEKNIQQDRPAFHGSDIEQIEQYYKIPAESIIKFGANVNPLGLSATLKKDLAEHLDVITSYPDREYKELRSAIARLTSPTRWPSSKPRPRGARPAAIP